MRRTSAGSLRRAFSILRHFLGRQGLVEEAFEVGFGEEVGHGVRLDQKETENHGGTENTEKKR